MGNGNIRSRNNKFDLLGDPNDKKYNKQEKLQTSRNLRPNMNSFSKGDKSGIDNSENYNSEAYINNNNKNNHKIKFKSIDYNKNEAVNLENINSSNMKNLNTGNMSVNNLLSDNKLQNEYIQNNPINDKNAHLNALFNINSNNYPAHIPTEVNNSNSILHGAKHSVPNNNLNAANITGNININHLKNNPKNINTPRSLNNFFSNNNTNENENHHNNYLKNMNKISEMNSITNAHHINTSNNNNHHNTNHNNNTRNYTHFNKSNSKLNQGNNKNLSNMTNKNSNEIQIRSNLQIKDLSKTNSLCQGNSMQGRLNNQQIIQKIKMNYDNIKENDQSPAIDDKNTIKNKLSNYDSNNITNNLLLNKQAYLKNTIDEVFLSEHKEVKTKDPSFRSNSDKNKDDDNDKIIDTKHVILDKNYDHFTTDKLRTMKTQDKKLFSNNFANSPGSLVNDIGSKNNREKTTDNRKEISSNSSSNIIQKARKSNDKEMLEKR